MTTGSIGFQAASGAGSLSGNGSNGGNGGERTKLDPVMLDIDGCVTLEEVGVSLGHKHFFAMLRVADILDDLNRPYEQHVEDGHILFVEMANGIETAIVTPKGQVWLARKFPATPACFVAIQAGMQ